MISGRASGSSTFQRIWRSVMPMPRAASLTELGTLARPTHRVAVDDLQRVGAEGDDRRVAAAAGERQQQEEEGDAGDRVEDPGAASSGGCSQRRRWASSASAKATRSRQDRPRSRPVRGAGPSASRSGRCCPRPVQAEEVASVAWQGRVSRVAFFEEGSPTSPTAARRQRVSHAVAPRRCAPPASPPASRGTRR